MVQLHVLFFPLMAHGHMIPTVDMAKLFSSHGVKATIITTPLNLSVFTKPIEDAKKLSGIEIGIRVIKFAGVEAGLPEGCECLDQLSSEDMVPLFLNAVAMLQAPLEQLLQEYRPNCLIADMFFPWATDAAAKFDIPRLIFHGTSTFALCASEILRRDKPHANILSDSEHFVIPNLPHEIKLTRRQLPPFELENVETPMSRMLRQVRESEVGSFGVVINSFYELEPDYADCFRTKLGRRAWYIGPLSVCNRDIEDKAQRGKKSSINAQDCLKWLDSKKPNSVVYVCFGSMATFTKSQLREIALGLEASEQEFIWAVRKDTDEAGNHSWLPEGFEERTKNKGLIIRGWAPQVLILDHASVGTFVTHCGWNSTLEGLSAGVPMVTWPVFAEQFYNEKLVTQVLRTGVAVGCQQWQRMASDGVKSAAVADAIHQVMAGEESEEIRKRAKAIKEMARKAVEWGGSSYSGLDALIAELSTYHPANKQETD